MKKHTYIVFTVAVLALVLSAFIAACSKPAEPAAPAGNLDGKTLVEERCGTHHDLARVENAKKTAEEWEANVKRMVGKGAQLNADEQKAVIEYLAATYK
jgi:hypothetical protein